MKKNARIPFGQLTALSIPCLLAAFGLSAQANDYTWDTAAGDSSITEGSGTWAAASGNWFDGVSYDQNWIDGNGAIFGGGTAGTAGTVTLGGPITTTSLIFNTPFSGNYTIDTATFGLTLNSPANITDNESAIIQSGTGGSVTLGTTATVDVAAGKTLTISSPINGSATVGLTKTGNGMLELDGTNAFGSNTRGLTISGGGITVGGTGALLGSGGIGCVVTNNGALIFNSSSDSLVYGFCSGMGTWEQKGPGMFTFSGGANYTFTGNVTLSGGILRAGINSATIGTRTNNLGAGASQLFLNGGELQCATGNNTVNNADVNYGRNTTVGGSGVTITSDRNTTKSPQGNAVTYTFGTLSIGNQTLTVQAGSSGITNGTAGIAFGNVSLTGAPTFLVNSNVANVTTLLTLGAISNDVNLVTFDGTGNSRVNGVIGGGAGTGGLTKNGDGKLTLAGANTYTGLTTISKGTLWVQGSVAGAATVGTGAVLGGNGTILGAVTSQTGATLSPGTNAIGALSINNSLTLNAGSTTLMELDQTAGTSDQVLGLTSVTYGGTLVVTNLNGVVTNGSQFTLFSATSSSGNFSSISGSPGANLAWSFNPANGVLSAVSGVSPTNTLHATISSSTLTLTWPNPGWYAQSNSVNLADTNYWFDLAGSQAGTNLVITVNPAQTNVFYRLRKP